MERIITLGDRNDYELFGGSSYSLLNVFWLRAKCGRSKFYGPKRIADPCDLKRTGKGFGSKVLRGG